jgi:hypothetical protein
MDNNNRIEFRVNDKRIFHRKYVFWSEAKRSVTTLIALEDW